MSAILKSRHFSRSKHAEDVHVGTNVSIRGIVRNSGLPGVLLLTRKSTHWEQRGRWTTSHLNRDYVCRECLLTILETWTPNDFRSAEVTVLDDVHETKQNFWSHFEDGKGVPTKTTQ